MNFHLKNSRISKLLLLITTSIVLVFIINQAQAQEKEATRLKALESEVFYDKNTGLEWLAGPDKATSWYDAKKWVESLTAVAGGGWRMPTRQELKNLYKKGVGKRNMTPLLKTTGWRVWSGETKDSSSAWGFDFLIGTEDWYFYFYTGGPGSAAWYDRGGSSITRGFAVRSRR